MMMKKPDNCCKVGTYEHSIPIPLNGRVQGIDFCVVGIVSALNAAGIETRASCCGHGKRDGNIILEDGRILIIRGG
jgi:hypothetical protein